LVISSEKDLHAKVVLERLRALDARAGLLDLSDYPQRWRLSMNYGRPAGQDHRLRRVRDGEFALSECGVIWWRRPQPFELHPEIADHGQRSFVYTECLEALSGMWLSLDACWINQPTRDDEAARKAFQLKVAQKVGLEVPITLITNNPDDARDFVATHGPERTVFKAFSATLQHWRETRLLREDEVALLDNVRFAPVIFQEYIPARVDLRVTVVGGIMFASAVHSQATAYHVDYRIDLESAQVEPFELPTTVVERLRTLMDRLGLVYGAIDMRLTPEGRFVFLEINPSGQWLFMEERTGQPITDAFVRLLIDSDGGASPDSSLGRLSS
jgi:hypothetical protein